MPRLRECARASSRRFQVAIRALVGGRSWRHTLSALFAELDKLAENADARGEPLLGALYDYAESISP
jgi:exodeoxyribonuclease-1